MARHTSADSVSVDHHRVRLTNLDKVLYPETGVTKGDVIEYALARSEGRIAQPDPLRRYREKRSAGRTPEPMPGKEAPLPRGNDDTFVIQEHHASRRPVATCSCTRTAGTS